MARDRGSPAILVSLRSPGKKQADPVDLKGRIVSFSFDDDEKKADKGTLVLDNFDLKFYDEPAIVEGNVLDITWGYSGLFSQTQSLVIKSFKGGQTLSVTLESKKQLINRNHESRVFEYMSYSQIATKIAEENGYRSDQIFVDDTEPVLESVSQARMTQAQFLRHLANKLGFEWYVDADGFHFHERKIGQKPVRRFVYYNDPDQGDIISGPTIEVKTNAVAGKVTAKGRDPSKKKTFSASSSAATDGGNQSAVEFVTVGDGTGLQKVTANNPSTPASNIATSDSMPSSASSATANAAIARGKQRRSSVNTVKLTMSCIGDPEITAKAMIEVTNIGKSFSGLYYVEKVKHSISSGYTMSLTCKRKGRNSSIGGVTGVAPVGKVNKQSAPDQKSTERIPEVIFEASEDGTGLVQKTVYKKQGKQSK